MTTHNTDREKLEACPWCPTTRRETYNTEGGVVGVIIHHEGCFLAACERRQILTPKGVIAWNSRAAVAAPQGDAHARASQLVNLWVVDRRLRPPQRYVEEQDTRILKEWIAQALTDWAASRPKCDLCSHGFCRECGTWCCKCGDGKVPRSSPVAPSLPEQEHPEDSCKKCGGPNVVWFAPNSLWNKVVRARNQPGILCPVCFIELAEAIGISEVWKVAPNEKSARKLTLPELNHLSGLLEARRDEGSYSGPREQYYARTERLIQWCNDQMKGQSNGPSKDNRNLS